MEPTLRDAMTIGEMLAEARLVHPQVRCDDQTFAEFIASRDHRGADRETMRARADELYLVCACLACADGAIDRLDQLYLADCRRAIARIDPDPAFVSRLELRVRDALLVGDGHPRLDDFTGQAPLSAWIRVFAIRIALESTAGSSIGGQAVVDRDPILTELQATHGAALAVHVRDALANLDMRMRTALRMHLNDHAGVEDIARLFRVHRVTVMGWLETAMRQVRTHVLSCMPQNENALGAPPRASRSQILRLALSSTIVAR